MGKISVEFLIETSGLISTNFVFAFLGISAPLLVLDLKLPLIALCCAALLISRTFSVFLISLIVNCYRKKKIHFSHQIIMSYGGIRGVVSFYLALVIHDEYKHLVIMTTICVILVTIFVCGTTTS
jgi:NhaP-type Na+/H+ or K+/H+ antiporter